MTPVIVPDPLHPQGGWSLMRVDIPPGATVTLAIRDLSSEQWLSAEGWQPSQTTLDGFNVSPTGDLLLGPAIVDRIDPYTALEVIIDGKKWRLAWPDTVAVSPGGLQSGGLQVTRRRETSPLEGRVAKPLAAPEPEPETPTEFEAAPELVSEDTNRTPRRLPFVILGLVGVFAMAALLAYLLLFDTPDPDLPPEPVAEAEETACSPEDFAARATLGYDAQMAAAVQCGGSTAPGDLLRILEAGVRAEQADALLRMARLYDPAVTEDAGLELSSRDPAIAAEYYARAATAGSTGTRPALSAACALLDPENLLHATVRDQYCP